MGELEENRAAKDKGDKLEPQQQTLD